LAFCATSLAASATLAAASWVLAATTSPATVVT
jgi:hypothetical protein